MRKIGRYRKKKQKKILIIGSLSLLLFLCVGYAAFSTNLSITAKGNIKEKTRVIQAWTSTDQTDFHSDFYKENIVSVTFLDNNNVPSNATESWNVSEDKENGGVMAWIIPNNNDNTKYDLYIGAKGGVIANEDSSDLFRNFINAKYINFNNNFDTSNTKTMADMFRMWDDNTGQPLIGALENINFGNTFDTSNVTSMNGMFLGCSNLKSLDVTGFNTSNVTDMWAMFSRCSSLTELDLSSFNTSNVTIMQDMFDYSMLTELNLCSFDTHNVTSMISMFKFSSNLKQVKVGNNWTTNNVDVTNMFYGSGVSSVTTGQC